MSSSKLETQKRLKVVVEIDNYIKNSNLTGLLVAGSLAWGKNSAVNKKSDIDIFIIANSKEEFLRSISGIPSVSTHSKKILMEQLNYIEKPINAISTKTNIGIFNGVIYLFTENEIIKLTNRLNLFKSEYFNNLRNIKRPQMKEYKGLMGGRVTFTTPITKAGIDKELWIRKDPLCLIKSGEIFGSIFISQLVFGEIYTDKNNFLHLARENCRRYLKSALPKQKGRAIECFNNYLPRIERMNNLTIEGLFKQIWF